MQYIRSKTIDYRYQINAVAIGVIMAQIVSRSRMSPSTLLYIQLTVNLQLTFKQQQNIHSPTSEYGSCILKGVRVYFQVNQQASFIYDSDLVCAIMERDIVCSCYLSLIEQCLPFSWQLHRRLILFISNRRQQSELNTCWSSAGQKSAIILYAYLQVIKVSGFIQI